MCKLPKSVGRGWSSKGSIRNEGKVDRLGCNGMFIGHALNMARDVQHMYVPRTNTISCSRNIQWMKRMHFRLLVRLPVATIDLLELIGRSGKIGTLAREGTDTHDL